MKALASTLITIVLNVAYVLDVLLKHMAPAELFVALPFLLANVASVAMLLASLRSKPIKTDERWLMFFAALIASNVAAVLHFAGVPLVSSHLMPTISLVAQLLTLALVPFYVLAILTLGKQLTVVPEARKLITRGPYSVSRHPLYVTYIIWHLLQIAVAQTWIVVALSAIMVVLLTYRAVGEEAILSAAFPDEYSAYRERVGWLGLWSPSFAFARQ